MEKIKVPPGVSTEPPKPKEAEPDKFKAPQGAMALVILYIIIVIVLWGSTYLTMLARGMTR